MSLTLYFHPFSSYCQKALIALYEKDVAFERRVIDLGDPDSRGELERLWPLTRFPVLRDEARGATVPEASLIVEYVDRLAPDGAPFVPSDDDAALRVRLLDRVFDNYVMTPMQKIVTDSFRAPGRNDPEGVEQAKALLYTSYAWLDAELPTGAWAAGDSFTLADCAAAPALFYANIVRPFADYGNLSAYYARVRARPSFSRAVDEARPFRHFFPLDWPPTID